MGFPYEIMDRLVAQGVGAAGVDLFIGPKAVIPPGEGPYVTLVETGGSGASRTQGGASVEHPSLQIMTRGTSHKATRTKAQACYAALGGANGLHNVTLSGTFYLNLTARQGLTDMVTDDDARSLVVFNVDAEKQPS